MAERSVTWKAFAEFGDLHRQARKAEDDFKRIKRAEDDANKSSVDSNAKVEASERQRLKTQTNLIDSLHDHVKARQQASQAETDSIRSTRAQTTAQEQQSRGLKGLVNQLKDYGANVQKMAALESRAGGAKKALTDAQKAHTRALKDSETASDRLARAEQRLTQVHQISAREVEAATNARARATNTAERAALSLAAAESKLAAAQRSSGANADTIRRAEISVADARISSTRAAQLLESSETRLQRAKQRSSKDSDAIRRAERDVAAAMTATGRAAGNLEQSTKRVSDVFDVLKGSGSGLGGMFGQMGQAFGKFASSMASTLPTLLALIALVPVVISFVSVLISGVVSLGAAAVALTAALSPLVGVLGALPGAIAGAALAIGTLAAAFSGVGEAVKETLNVQKNAGKVARDSAKAQRDAARRVADAYRNLQRAKESQARGEVAANRAVRDARRALADAEQSALDNAESARRNVTSSEQSLVRAQENATQAQRDLNQARKDAVRNLKDLKNAVDDAALSEERGALSLEQARQRLQEVLSDPASTDLEKRDAALAVKEAMASLRDVQQQAADTRAEYAKAQKQGVEKSDAVIAAKRNERDALQSLADAQRSVADAVKAQTRQQVESARAIASAQENLANAIDSRAQQQKDAAQTVADAQRSLGDAYDSQKDAANVARDATEKLRQALENLSPAGQRFVAFLVSLKPLLDKIRFAAQEGLFPGLTEALQTLAKLAPVITPAVKSMGEAIGKAAANIAKLMTTPLFKEQLTRILDSSVKIMGTIGRIVGNLVIVFTNIADAARPFTEWLFTTAEGWSKSWAAMTSGKSGQKKLTDFFAETKRVLQVVGQLLTGVVSALFGIGKASKGVGDKFLQNLANAATKFAEFVNSKEGQARIKKWFEDMAPIAQSVADAIVAVVKGILDIADDPDAKKFFDALANDFLPAMVEAFKSIGSGPARAGLDALWGLVRGIGLQADNINEFVDNISTLVDLLFGIDQNAPGASNHLADFITGITAPAGLMLLNDGLEKLIDFLKWLKGDDSAKGGAGGGSWGKEGPLAKLGETLDWLGKKISDFLTTLGKIWPTFLSIFTTPIATAINFIHTAFENFNKWLVGKILTLITWIKTNWSKVSGFLTDPVGTALPVLRDLATKVKGVFDDLWSKIVEGSRAFGVAIKGEVEKIRGIFADPINFVLNEVINKKLIDGFNFLSGQIHGPTINHIPGFATGGVYPGYTPGRDIGYIGVSGGEAIMRPEWTRAVGKGEVDRMNAAARRGGSKGVRRYLGGFASGGSVEGLRGGGEFARSTFRGKTLNQRTVKMLLAAEKLLGSTYRITQGSWSTSVAASGNTHAGGGVLDVGWNGSNASVVALRRAGFAAWHRNPLQGPWADHIHAVALGDPTESIEAKRQVASYLAGGNGLGGTDDGPRVAIDTNLAQALGITDADVAKAMADSGGGGNLLSKLAGWIQKAVGNPLNFLKEKIADPVKSMMSKFGDTVLTQTLAKVPEYAFDAMGTAIKNTIGNFFTGDPSAPNGSADIKAMVQSKASSFGWDNGSNWDALQWIISKESSWNPNAQNPNSTAYGLFQFLDGTWSQFGKKTSDPGLQTDYGLRYIKSRYGSPDAARAFHQNYGWYASGGVVPSSPVGVQAFARGGTVGGVGNRDTVPAMLTPGEFVLRKDVARRIGHRKLERLNAGRTSRLKPTDAGIQHFHAGGPVLGLKKGANLGSPIRALRFLLGWPANDSGAMSTWDATLDTYLKKPGAAGRLNGPPAVGVNNPNRWKLINYLRDAKSPRSFDQARGYMRLSDPYLMKLWQSVNTYTQKSVPRQKWGLFNNGYLNYFTKAQGWIRSLNARIGLGAQGDVWNSNSRNAMHHVLEHAYGQSHSPLEYRPWQFFSPVETAAKNAIDQNKKQGEFNSALETLSNWGLTDLVQDLLSKGLDEGYTIATSAVKNRVVATTLNNEIKKSKLLTSEDQANILKMISTLAGSASVGLRDMARALGLSDLDTVTLWEKANQLGRISKVNQVKSLRLQQDIKSFRAGTFYANTGGQVPGSGNGDIVPAMLTPGEWVLRKEAAQALGYDYLRLLNDPRKYAKGGLVSQLQLAGQASVSMPRVGTAVRSGAAGAASTGGVTVNYDIDIINPVAEPSTRSMTKALQRAAVIRGPGKEDG